MVELNYAVDPAPRHGLLRALLKSSLRAIALIALLLLVVYVYVQTVGARFWSRMDTVNAVGKSPAEITAVLGPPDEQITTWDADTVWVYFGPLGLRYRLDIRNGIAVSSLHTAQP